MHRRAPIVWVGKIIASSSFVLFAIWRGALDSPYGLSILVALILSWWGDLFLLSTSSRAFLAGLVSFLLAHVAFVISFIIRGSNPQWLALASVAVLVVSGLVLRWLIPQVTKKESKMKIPVICYATVISLMVIFGAGASGSTGDWRIVVAAVMFYFSDLSVARERFVAPGPANKVWGWPLYYAAQFLFGLTIGR